MIELDCYVAFPTIAGLPAQFDAAAAMNGARPSPAATMRATACRLPAWRGYWARYCVHEPQPAIQGRRLTALSVVGRNDDQSGDLTDDQFD
ncbi:MAG: hypothetical protein AAF224_06785 [Pseudomonadota bacterium]